MTDEQRFYFFFGAENPCSNWHLRDFTLKGINFTCVEQALMFSKAKLFGDEERAEEILLETYQGEMRRKGRMVRPFVEKIWHAKRGEFAFAAKLAQFEQNPDLAEWLLGLGRVWFVEASRFDREWGCGLDANDPRIHDHRNWTGKNICGQTVDRVAATLRFQRGL